MLDVAVCDDVPRMTTDVESLLTAYNSSLFNIHIFFTPEKLIRSLTGNHYDFFILDIQLPEYSGIQLAEVIRKTDYNAPIIFLTSFTEYMEDVFKVQTFDYLLKPVSRQKFFPVLDKVIKYLDIENRHFVFSFNHVSYNLELSKIVFFEKRGRQVIIHTINDTYLANMSTATILAKVSDDFVQTHTSYIINISYIKEVSNRFIILSDHMHSYETPLSRKFKETARSKILMHLRNQI